MKFRSALALILAAVCSLAAHAQLQAVQRFCEVGGVKVLTQGINSTTTVQASYPKCSVTVYLTGTTTKPTIYSDGLGITPLANPFTANTNGSFLFYAATGAGYDIVLSGGTPLAFPAPYTITDVVLGGGSGTALTLQTNNVNNGSQSLLNLFAGSNITLADNGSGRVTISSTGGSGTPGGSNHAVQFNSSSTFGGTAFNGGVWASTTADPRAMTATDLAGLGSVIASNYGSINTFGDSICQGTGSANFLSFGSLASGYCQDLISDFGGNGANYGFGGDQAADTSIKVFNAATPSANNNPVTTIMVSTNDVNIYGTNTNQQNIFKRALTHAIAWASTPDVNKSLMVNTALCARTGTWALDGPKIYSVTNGSTLTCSVTVPAGVTLLSYGYQVSDAYTGSATITIDGTSPTNDATVSSFGQGGALIATANGAIYTFFSALYAVSPGTHTFVLTVAGSGVVEPVWLGSPSIPTATAVAPPLVLVGGTPWNLGDSPSTTTAAYNTIISGLVSQMKSGGYPTCFVDIRNGVNTCNANTFTPLNSTTDYAGGQQGTVSCPVAPFPPYHPNSSTSWSRSCGHGHLAAGFEAALNFKIGGPSTSQVVSGPVYPSSAAVSRSSAPAYALALNARLDPGSYVGMSYGYPGDNFMHFESNVAGGYAFDLSTLPAYGVGPTVVTPCNITVSGFNCTAAGVVLNVTDTETTVGGAGYATAALLLPTLAVTAQNSLIVGATGAAFNNAQFGFVNWGGASNASNYAFMGMNTGGSAFGVCVTGSGNVGLGIANGQPCPTINVVNVGTQPLSGTNGYGLFVLAPTGATNNYTYGSNGFKVDGSGNMTVASCTGCGGAGSGFPITIGSTSIASSSTTTTIAGLTLTAPVLGTPTSVTLTNGTGLPISTGVSGLGTGVATFLATPNSANLATAITDETGTGLAVFNNAPTLIAPVLGTPASGVMTNVTGTATGLTSGGAINLLVCADTSASGTAQTCTTSPSFTPAANSCVVYTTTTANSGAGLTLNVNALGAKSVAKWQGATTLVAGDVPANKPVLACYDGTNWGLSTIGNAPSGSSGLSGMTATQIPIAATASTVTSSIAIGAGATVCTGPASGLVIGHTASFTATTNCQIQDSGNVAAQTPQLNATTNAFTGTLSAKGWVFTGTKFTNSGCSVSASTGGALGGTVTLGANTCTLVITPGITATNGFTCKANDRTAPTVLIGGESSSTTTTASFTIPAGAGATDVISFSCFAF